MLRAAFGSPLKWANDRYAAELSEGELTLSLGRAANLVSAR